MKAALPSLLRFALACLLCASACAAAPAKPPTIVLISGEFEYHSAESLPLLQKQLESKLGAKCVLLQRPADPKAQSIAGLEALATADLAILYIRRMTLPEEQLAQIRKYAASGRPIIGLRTSTHAFSGIAAGSPYAKYNWNNKADWIGGFGRQVLGETWVAHHGGHGSEATRGVIEESGKDDPILRGVTDIFGPTDVYTANPLAESKILVRGQVVKGMNPTDGPVVGKKNEPMQPIIWTRMHKNEAGTTNKILCTTMGAASDLPSEGLRRVIVNGAYWATGLEVPANADVTVVGEFKPSKFGFGSFIKGVKPEAHELK